ncbi:hypothetical protein [uncultured Sphingomonas sp.]|uniref:hypothetical protein n=1 Tax=uncultured Sphingomonas sp. TaxID=158754 RepID=UPI0035CA6F0D
MTQRDSHGRFKADHHHARNVAIGATAALGALAAGVVAAFHFGKAAAPGNAEHPAPDLAPDAPPPGRDGRRAPEAFRPDPTAAVPASEREALRPATGPSPSMVADRGSMRSETAPLNG